MNILLLDSFQLGFVIGAPIVVLLALAILLYFPIRKAWVKKKYRDVFSKKVYKTALYRDFYLINDFVFKYDDSHGTIIDHILYGDKFIYLISDRYYDGSIQGKPNDASLILISKKGKKFYIDNPINDSKKLLKRLSATTGIDPSIFIGITLINGDCMVDVEQTLDQFYIIQNDRFYDLIKAIEERDVSPIKPTELAKLVKDMDRINKKRKKPSDSKRNPK